MIESGYRSPDIARAWKFGVGSLVPLAEGAASWGEPDLPSLALCSEGKIAKNSRSSYMEKKGKGKKKKKKKYLEGKPKPHGKLSKMLVLRRHFG